MTSLPWFRFYSEALQDRKLAMAARAAGVDRMTMFGIWTALLCLANESPIRGKLYVTLQKRYGNRDVTNELDIDDVTWEKVAAALKEYEMLDEIDGVYCIRNWDKRQPAGDSSAERVRKFRQKQNSNGRVTLPKRSVTPIDIDKELDIVRQLETAFINTSGIPAFGEDDLEILASMAKAGCLPDDMTEGVKTLQRKKYTIKGVKSIETTVINIAKQRMAKTQPADEVFFEEWG